MQQFHIQAALVRSRQDRRGLSAERMRRMTGLDDLLGIAGFYEIVYFGGLSGRNRKPDTGLYPACVV